MVRSRLNWFTVLIAGGLIFFGAYCFILSAEFIISNSSINGKWLLLSLFIGTIEVRAILSLAASSKIVSITNETLTIEYLFIPRKYAYSVSELEGYHRNRHKPVGGRLPYHKSLDILTRDGKLFILNSLIFSNFTELANAIATKSKSIKIDKWNFNIKQIKLTLGSIVVAFLFLMAILLMTGRQ